MKKQLSIFAIAFLAILTAQAQPFTRADSLRGALRNERNCYDVTWYDLSLKVDPATQSIDGKNDIWFSAITPFSRLQIDLFPNLDIKRIQFEGNDCLFQREHNAVFVDFPREVKKGEKAHFSVEYAGKPNIARNAPWDGGFVWSSDGNGKPWIGVACEGHGASSWWPLKDHLSDEPDSMRITTIVPDTLMSVSNGNLRKTETVGNGWKKYEWAVTYPINSYNVTVNIGDYIHWHADYQNATGVHDLDYYVLRENESKARKQFLQVGPMMKCYEDYFGEYPFWNDGYALVETPYLGMEHQGAIAYGNHYRPGYNGYDPLNLKFDYIIIHETGHEWWGNSVSASDHADLWIHESFCTYGEALYVECMWDYATAVKYLVNQRPNIRNLTPMVGPRDVNYEDWSGSDIYYKGSWMLHTLRNVVNDNAKWKTAIYQFATQFKHKVTSTDEVIAWFNQHLGMDLTPVFRQYLYHTALPKLEYKLSGKKLQYRWKADEPGFNMPVRVKVDGGDWITLTPTLDWQKKKLKTSGQEVEADLESFLIRVKEAE